MSLCASACLSSTSMQLACRLATIGPDLYKTSPHWSRRRAVLGMAGHRIALAILGISTRVSRFEFIFRDLVCFRLVLCLQCVDHAGIRMESSRGTAPQHLNKELLTSVGVFSFNALGDSHGPHCMQGAATMSRGGVGVASWRDSAGADPTTARADKLLINWPASSPLQSADSPCPCPFLAIAVGADRLAGASLAASSTAAVSTAGAWRTICQAWR